MVNMFSDSYYDGMNGPGRKYVSIVALTILAGSWSRHWAVTIGVGAMIGLGSIFYFLGLMRLPVSITVGVANGYVVVTILLSVLIGHAALPWSKRLAIALTVAGVALFTVSAK